VVVAGGVAVAEAVVEEVMEAVEAVEAEGDMTIEDHLVVGAVVVAFAGTFRMASAIAPSASSPMAKMMEEAEVAADLDPGEAETAALPGTAGATAPTAETDAVTDLTAETGSVGPLAERSVGPLAERSVTGLVAEGEIAPSRSRSRSRRVDPEAGIKGQIVPYCSENHPLTKLLCWSRLGYVCSWQH